MNNIFCRILSFSHSRPQLYLNFQISIVKDTYKYVEYSHKLISIGDVFILLLKLYIMDNESVNSAVPTERSRVWHWWSIR